MMPTEPFVKPNTDVGFTCTRAAMSVGVLRDCNGDWKWGYYHNIESFDILRAELWTIRAGLRLAGDADITHLIVECDSSEAIRLLHHDLSSVHPHFTIFKSGKELIQGF